MLAFNLLFISYAEALIAILEALDISGYFSHRRGCRTALEFSWCSCISHAIKWIGKVDNMDENKFKTFQAEEGGRERREYTRVKKEKRK